MRERLDNDGGFHAWNAATRYSTAVAADSRGVTYTLGSSGPLAELQRDAGQAAYLMEPYRPVMGYWVGLHT